MKVTERRPYSISENGFHLVGPTKQPADIRDVDDPDGFAEFCNDLFELGFEAGMAEQGEVARKLHRMVQHWGERCAEEEEGCSACAAWKHFDETGEVME